MACKTLELHHHFPRLAEESGFTFNVHRARGHIDWNKIRQIDVESIIKERKFNLIEQHMNDILYCVLESEFDLRILDEGVIKMFRLAQLSVEYQQFCRHYLDRSVCVLREEITGLAKELDVTKKTLREKEDELKKLKRKAKHPYRTPLPYGNDNIATMILKTLSNKSDIFPTTSNADSLQYNKCSYCDKVFLNQLYLKSHLSRRHTSMIEIPQKDVVENDQSIINEKENSKLNAEITELKAKLKEMESLLLKFNNQNRVLATTEEKPAVLHKENESTEKQTKDAEVSTNNETYLLDKIEEWKKEEHEKYNKEINLLRTQIVDIVNSFKPNEEKKPAVKNEQLKIIDQLHTTIKQQGVEIHYLKQELEATKLRTENEELERKKELDKQMSWWTKRAENQTRQYEALLQKLNDLAQEALEARAQAETERTRVAQLQVLLHEAMNNKHTEKVEKPNTPNIVPHHKQNGDIRKKVVKRKPVKSQPTASNKTLESLHRKAQELLNMATTSSSDASSASIEIEQTVINTTKNGQTATSEKNRINSEPVLIRSHNKLPINSDELKKTSNQSNEIHETKEHKVKKDKIKSHSNIVGKVGNGTIIAPGSPMKLVRNKITEEVNNRLVTIGIDPLKNRLPKGHFQKQRLQLQREYEDKSKKNRVYEKVKHSILTYLDSSTSEKNREVPKVEDYVSPNKTPRTFSIASVLSNVKSKALSLVKPIDNNVKSKRKEINAEVAKKALILLKTPPESATNSPAKQRKVAQKTTLEENESSQKKPPEIITLQREKYLRTKKQMKPKIEDSADDSSDSDHKYYNPAVVQRPTKSIENLIKSPARRPASANADYNSSIHKLATDKKMNLLRSQSEVNISEVTVEKNFDLELHVQPNNDDTSDELSAVETAAKKTEITNVPKQTKGVLKNASSTSSLNKKKVLFDMDAIQMKSVSASPSQSITEKSDNEKFELGLVNLDGDEWDLSSIENEPLKNDTKVQLNLRTSPKIAELKQTIESQLARRTETPSTVLVGGVNLMPTPMARTSSLAGSNTSLGSSILDESDGIPTINHKAFIKPRKVTEKEDSEVDISEYSFEGITTSNKKSNDSF